MSLVDALQYIRIGKADVMVVGGARSIYYRSWNWCIWCHETLIGTNVTLKHCTRPFDLYRDGFVMGEGTGCMIVESLEHAQKEVQKFMPS